MTFIKSTNIKRKTDWGELLKIRVHQGVINIHISPTVGQTRYPNYFMKSKLDVLSSSNMFQHECDSTRLNLYKQDILVVIFSLRLTGKPLQDTQTLSVVPGSHESVHLGLSTSASQSQVRHLKMREIRGRINVVWTREKSYKNRFVQNSI